MQSQRNQIIQRHLGRMTFVSVMSGLAILLVLFLAIQFCLLAVNGFVADSEFWSLTLASHFSSEWFHPWVITRIAFYLPLSLAIAPFTSPEGVFYAGKIACLVNGLLLLAFCYQLARKLAAGSGPFKKIIPLFALILILSNPAFMNQGYRIRSDLFACTLWLAVLNLIFYKMKRETFSSKDLVSSAFKDFAWWFLPILATPKAALQMIPAFGLVDWPKWRNMCLHLRPWQKGLLLLSAATGFTYVFAVFYYSSFIYFFHSYRVTGQGSYLENFFSADAFFYLNRLLKEDLVFGALVIFRTVTYSARQKCFKDIDLKKERMQRKFACLCLFQPLAIFLSPEKYPFFLACFLLPQSIYASLCLSDLWILRRRLSFFTTNLKARVALFGFFLLIAVASVLNGIKYQQIFLTADNCKKQVTFINYLDAYLKKYPKANYYDGIGIIANRATFLNFPGPNDYPAIEWAVKLIETTPPDFIFYTSKMALLEPRISQLLEENYFPLDQGAFAHWTKLTTPLPIISENIAELAKKIADLEQLAGSPPGQTLHFEVMDLAKHTKVIEATEQSLLRSCSGCVVTRLAVFTKFVDPPPYFIGKVFSFDADPQASNLTP